MNTYLQISLCLAIAAAMVSGTFVPGYPGAYGHYAVPGVYGPYGAVAHHGGYYGGAGDQSGAYVHDPTGDHAPAYVHDPTGDTAPAYNHYADAYGHGGGYYGPLANHVLGVPVHDTPEVAAAKAAHFAAVAAAQGHHYG